MTSLAIFAFFGVPVLVLLVALAGLALNTRATREAALPKTGHNAQTEEYQAKVLYEIAGQFGSPVTATATLPDGLRGLSGSQDGTLRLWDLKSGNQLSQFVGHADPITTIEILPDGLRALCGSQDGTLRLWDLESGVGLAVRRPNETTNDIEKLQQDLADIHMALMKQTREQAPTDWTAIQARLADSQAALTYALMLNRGLEVEVAKALVSKGVALTVLGRSHDAIAVFDDVLARFGAATDLLVRGQADKAQSFSEPLQTS